MDNELLFSLMEDTQYTDIMLLDIVDESDHINIPEKMENTGMKYKNVNITFSTKYSDINQFELNKKAISEFDKIINTEFTKLVPTAQSWGVSIKNTSDLLKLYTLESVYFYGYGKKDITTFELIFNNIPNSDIIGGHTITIYIDVKNGKVIKSVTSLDG